MERIALTGMNLGDAAKKAAAVLRRGGVVLYPTSTLYGLGADALSDAAVDLIYRIKARDMKKPMHSLVTDESMAQRYGVIDARARALIALNKAISLIVPKRPNCKSGICRSADTFGFRVAHHPFCRTLLAAAGFPVTTTSANRAGRLPERSIDAILEQLGDTAHYIDLIVDAGELPGSTPSTIVDLSGDDVVILREGTVDSQTIRNAIAG